MRGMIAHKNGRYNNGWITGDDGIIYFFHGKDCNSGSTRKGSMVEFDIVDEGREHLRALNIKKIGLGKNHPFYRDCKCIAEFITKNTEPSKEQSYILQCLQTMCNYYKTEPLLLPNGRDPYLPERSISYEEVYGRVQG